MLRDVPRTATVRALEPSRPRALPWADFLRALSVGAGSAAAAEAVASARLVWGRPA